ncbi:MAG: oligosaccharide flippase family protein [Saprospiraceae bacterium]|nr:oligosaccharide flippase family protein [Saprospiraceae bacterium]
MSSIIQIQGFKFSIIHYAGVFIGIISTLLIYPQDLNLYGFYGFLTNAASLLSPIVSLGFGFVMLRYFPHYRAEGTPTNSVFLRFIYSGYCIGIISFTILFICTSGFIADYFFKHDNLVLNHLIYLLPLTILFVVFEFMTNWSITHKEIALPAILSTSLKIILPTLFLLVIHKSIGYQGFLYCLMTYYIIIIFLILRFLATKEKLLPGIHSDLTSNLNKRELIQFAIYSMVTGTSVVLSLRIDSLMITSHIGTEANGKFSMIYFISNAAFIPAHAIYEILSPYIARHSKENSSSSIQSMYEKSVRNMLIPTLWASLCLYFCYDDLMKILPHGEKLASLKYSLCLLLIARVIDAATGVNHHILNFSKHYRIELVLLIILAFSNILFNLYFIPQFGIFGAALGTMISVSIFNISKSVIIYLKMGYYPFDNRFYKILIYSTLLILILSILPHCGNSLAQIIIIGSLTSLLFLFAILRLGISEELKAWIYKSTESLFRKSK